MFCEMRQSLPGNVFLFPQDMKSAVQMPFSFPGFGVGKKGTGFELGPFKPGLLAADSGLVKVHCLNHQNDEDRNGEEPGKGFHFFWP